MATIEPVPYPALKSATDKLLAAAVLLAASPVALCALVGIALDRLLVPSDRGPVFYRELRVSRGRVFGLLKFRTLRADVLARPGGVGNVRLLEADPANLTRAGRVLKRWYLDELPQLVNILRGEMSLVGPRPWPPSMVAEQVAAGESYRNLVMAGWTGPAQVTKGSSDPVDYRTLDLDYVERSRTQSAARLVLYDVGILGRTVLVLLRGQGLQY